MLSEAKATHKSPLAAAKLEELVGVADWALQLVHVDCSVWNSAWLRSTHGVCRHCLCGPPFDELQLVCRPERRQDGRGDPDGQGGPDEQDGQNRPDRRPAPKWPGGPEAEKQNGRDGEQSHEPMEEGPSNDEEKEGEEARADQENDSDGQTDDDPLKGGLSPQCRLKCRLALRSAMPIAEQCAGHGAQGHGP